MNTFRDVLSGSVPWAVALGDSLESLRTLPPECVHCAITSPPYYALRDYGVDGQIGLEKSPEEYVAAIVDVCREVKRVLHPSGTLWLNLGDSYATKPMGQGSTHDPKYAGRNRRGNRSQGNRRNNPSEIGCKHKDLIGIPWMVAFALRADGWYLRQDIIWHKPAPMPSSVSDRCTSSHEYLFLLSRSPRYFFDAEAISEPAVSTKGSGNGFRRAERVKYRNADGSPRGQKQGWNDVGGTRNKRSVWKISSKPYKGAHFATFPPKLVEPCVLAGTSARGVCPDCGAPWVRELKKERKPTRPGINTKVTAKQEGDGQTASTNGWNRANVIGNRDPQRHTTITETIGWRPSCKCDAGEPVAAVVLDFFAGSGTTLAVAVENGRRALGCELNPDYLNLIERRMQNVTPALFAG